MLKQENERKKEIADLEIISSEPELSYDLITELAAKICKAKAAMISFLDEDTQWVKSSFGLNIQEFPRQNSPCAQTVLAFELHEVENFYNDGRYRDNHFTQLNPPMTFYAGFPIKSGNSKVIGTICILDDKERALSGLEKESLKIMANLVTQLLAQKNNSLSHSNFQKIENAFLEAAEHNHEISSNLTTLMLTFDLNMKNIPQKFYDRAMGILDKISDRLKDIKILAQECISPESELNNSVQLPDSSKMKIEESIQGQQKILLVEDDEDQREFLSEVLEYKSTRDLKITAVGDGNQATQNSLSSKFDIIVTDYDIPKINGIDFIKACRSQGKNLETPIILTSGGMGSVDTGALLAYIPNIRILEKPFKVDDLIELMESIFTAQ